MFLFLLACATERQPETLRWFVDEVECEEGLAEWEMPETPPAVAWFTLSGEYDGEPIYTSAALYSFDAHPGSVVHVSCPVTDDRYTDVKATVTWAEQAGD